MRRKPTPPPKPKRRAPNSGSVTVRADKRVAVVLPKDLDPERTVIYSPPGTRQPFASREAGLLWLDAEIAYRRNPSLKSARPDELLGAYLARWYRNNSPDWPERTVKAYELSLRRWKIIGDVPLRQLTRDVISDALAEMRRQTWVRKKKDGTPTSKPKPYSARTIQHARTLLYQALEDLVPDVLPFNPAKLRRRARKAPEPEQPVWSADQADRFLDVAEKIEPRIALGFRLILWRALRTGEVVDLTWADVNERAHALTIDETAGLRRGSSGPTKTRRVRDVPLSADLIARLKAHRRQYPATDPHIFTIRGERISLAYFRDLWRHVVRVAQLPLITPKDGRATCATTLLDAGWPLPVVSQLLGHTNIVTTATFYARIVKRRAEQVAQLGEQLDASITKAVKDAAGDDETDANVSGNVSLT